MERKMGDNTYLHKDFHVSMDIALAYIDRRYKKEGVTEYLNRFTDSYHRDLINKISQEGLSPFKTYLENIFKAEECSDALSIIESEGTLHVKISKGFYVYTISGYSQLVLEKVYGTIIQKAGYRFELLFFDDMTGACEFKVKRIGR